MKPDWTKIAAAYEEAAEHLEICASQSEDPEEAAAQKLVAKRLRNSADRVKS